MSRHGPKEFGDQVSPQTRNILGQLRRMVVSLTTRALWQVVGHRLLDNTTETRDAEVFSGIGFYSRPSASGNPEAIVIFQGGAANPVIVATRDEKTRAAVAGSLAAGETAIFNSASIVVLKANGDIEIRSSGGDAAAVAMKADLDAFKAAILAWVPVASDGGAALQAKLTQLFNGPPIWPAGSQKVKLE